jgi:hypothetical protein
MTTTLTAILILALQDGGKLDWKGKGAADAGSEVEAAARAGKPALLFFTSDG